MIAEMVLGMHHSALNIAERERDTGCKQMGCESQTRTSVFHQYIYEQFQLYFDEITIRQY